MIRTIAILTVISVIGVGLLAFGATSPAAAAAQDDVKQAYVNKCAVCHGEDGAGKTAKGKKLKVKAVQETVKKMTVAQMEEIVTKGKDPDMDAFGKDLGPDMVKQITAYYRSLAAIFSRRMPGAREPETATSFVASA